MQITAQRESVTAIWSRMMESLGKKQQGRSMAIEINGVVCCPKNNQAEKILMDNAHLTQLLNLDQSALSDQQHQNKTFNNRNHFFAYSALAMRHILLNEAKKNRLLTFVDQPDELSSFNADLE